MGNKPRKGRKRRPRPSPEVMRKIRLIDVNCRWCLINPAETVDHIIPRSRGGSNKQINLVGSCQQCNHAKDNMLPKEAGMILHVPLRLMK